MIRVNSSLVLDIILNITKSEKLLELFISKLKRTISFIFRFAFVQEVFNNTIKYSTDIVAHLGIV